MKSDYPHWMQESFSDEEIERIEKNFAKQIIRIKGDLVEAENENGEVVEAILYHNQLFDLDCNPLQGYHIKKNWNWVLLACGCLSFYIIYLLIAGFKS